MAWIIKKFPKGWIWDVFFFKGLKEAYFLKTKGRGKKINRKKERGEENTQRWGQGSKKRNFFGEKLKKVIFKRIF